MSRGPTRGSGGGGGLGHRGWVQGGSALRLGSQLHIGMLVRPPASTETKIPVPYLQVPKYGYQNTCTNLL